MDRMEAEDFSLFGLLGRSWQLDSPVVDLTFDKNEGAVAFALADGSVAIARTKDSEPAARRIRISAEDGRSTILPRTKPLSPITRFTVQNGTAVALTAYGVHGFVLGDASGVLTSVTIGGERTPFAQSLGAPIIVLEHAPATGTLACATADHKVALIRRPNAEPEVLDHQSPIGALAFSADGRRLAVACQNLVTLWKIEEKVQHVADLQPCQSPACLAWSPDGSRVALGQETGGVTVWQTADETAHRLPDYPTAVRSLAWSSDGESLVTSGAFRIIAWPTKQLKRKDVHSTYLTTGKPSLTNVEAITNHPKRPLIAAGYENGMLILAQIGSQEELVLKTEGQGAITSVSWASRGDVISIGSEQGLAALVELPQKLLK